MQDERDTFVFPGQSPTELRADPFLSAHILQRAEEWLFREAERRWKEGDNPWRFLLGVKDLSPACYDFFRAAESVSSATELVSHCLYGGATIPRGPLADEAQRRAVAGDQSGASRTAGKVVRGMVTFGLWNDNGQPHAQLEAWKAKAEVDLRKRHGRKFEPSRLPTARQFNREAEAMIAGWLRLGNKGIPGFCFFTDEAMADLLALRLGGADAKLERTDVRLVRFRKLRQRLGLKHAYHPKPVVTRASRTGPRSFELVFRNDSGPPCRRRFDEQRESGWS
jgi:hypothetical protein